MSMGRVSTYATTVAVNIRRALLSPVEAATVVRDNPNIVVDEGNLSGIYVESDDAMNPSHK